MNKYKMICLDIDGTLLNSNHQISEETNRTIREVYEKYNIPVVLISARMPKGIVYLAEELGLKSPVVAYSGGLITEEGKILLNHTFPVSYAEDVYNHASNMGIHVSVYINDEWYVEKFDKESELESRITGIIPKTENFKNIFSDEKKAPNKILCISTPEKIKELTDKLNKIYNGKINIYASKDTYLEIMPENITKVTAIDFLCKKYNITKEEVIAMGDNFNDTAMISYCGMGVAMGNAPEGVKEKADFVTLTNDEHGVAYAVKKFCFEK